MSIKNFLNKLIYPNYCTSDAYVKFLRKGGAKIGEGTFFYGPKLHPVDETSLPYVEIGRNCRITSGVTILAHDYSYAVLRPIYHCMLCKAGVTKIGDNVFIGINSIITMGVEVGNNVIIGAGSVVTKNVPSNVVVAGNPAKVVCTLEEYYEKCNERFDTYAKIVYVRKKKNLGRELREDDMGWYVALWNSEKRYDIVSKMRVDGDNPEKVYKDVVDFPARYKSYEQFQNIVQRKDNR